MKKLRANTVLSAFIFGVSILLLCSFGTDTAYIILSRYKLQKIANAAALEYAAAMGRDANYNYGTECDCRRVKNKLERIYNTIGSGAMQFRFVSMTQKTNNARKETVVKVQVASKVMPAFLRFVGASEIFIHANGYAKTNYIEIEKTFDTYAADDFFADDEGKTYMVFPSVFTDDLDSSKKASVVTAKADLNGDFAIKLAYSVDDPLTGTTSERGGGFFIFAGYGPTLADARWVDIGQKVKKADPTDPNPWRRIEDPARVWKYTCVNGSDDSFEPVTVTFELSNEDEEETGGHINRFNYLKIYKAGAIAGTTLDFSTLPSPVTITNPCDPSYVSLMPISMPPFYIAPAAKIDLADEPEGYFETGSGFAPASVYSSRLSRLINKENLLADSGGISITIPVSGTSDPTGSSTSSSSSTSSGGSSSTSSGGGSTSSSSSSGGSSSTSSGGSSSSSSGGGSSSSSGGGSSSSSGGGTPPPNAFTAPATVKFIIMNNVSLISPVQYRIFAGDVPEESCPL